VAHDDESRTAANSDNERVNYEHSHSHNPASSNTLDPVVDNIFQFKCLNLVQKHLCDIKRFLWLRELFFCQCALHVAEKLEVRGRQIKTIDRMGHSNNIILGQKASEAFECWRRELSKCMPTPWECHFRRFGDTGFSSSSMTLLVRVHLAGARLFEARWSSLPVRLDVISRMNSHTREWRPCRMCWHKNENYLFP
jgi:hypothetical protein